MKTSVFMHMSSATIVTLIVEKKGRTQRPLAAPWFQVDYCKFKKLLIQVAGLIKLELEQNSNLSLFVSVGSTMFKFPSCSSRFRKFFFSRKQGRAHLRGNRLKRSLSTNLQVIKVTLLVTNFTKRLFKGVAGRRCRT